MEIWKKTEDLKIGDTIVESIISYPNSEIIASKGEKVSNTILTKFKNLNINWVKIEKINHCEEWEINQIFHEEKIKIIKRQVNRIWDEVIVSQKINLRKIEILSETFIKEIENNYGDLLAPNLCRIIEFDEYTFSHQVNVAVIASLIAYEISDENISFAKDIATGALIHDIGKIKVPKEILNLKRKLTDEEHNVIKHHVDFGYELAQDSSVNEQCILDCIKYHHEKWDGTGYRSGYVKDEIPLSARILAVADVYDALTTSRPYKNAWTPYQAVSYIIQQSGRQFDPVVVEYFLRIFGMYPVGTELRLSNGQKAVVIANNRHAISSPVVEVDGDYGIEIINLEKEKNIYIKEILDTVNSVK